MKIKKPFLFIYYPGARGDFLASTLIGDVLKTSYTDPFIRQTGIGEHYKMHYLGVPIIGPGQTKPCTVDSFADFYTIRIKHETPQDCNDVVKLSLAKMAEYNSTVDEAQAWENQFSQFDHMIDVVIPFRELFDVDKIVRLFQTYRKRVMNQRELHSLTVNIRLNLEILRG